ncbi:DUF2384 domain-containing protein [Porphyrobacter algicida]|uniref:DUF2384 domain-containing protein n=1 Tax=Qipengyuania algicida TaxID=1836209 RepID=A0A845AI42_9SPHN|nr:MbcA/ParS/Xre antitoxin family protein [Qipengyuania algicida]MXP29109.1 DUF2384 domain-containing protein [Qipengyuania algicida]
MRPKDYTTVEQRDRLSGPALRTFFNISNAWKLTDVEEATILGISDLAVLKRWKEGEGSTLSFETRTRISYILGIYKALHILIPQKQYADEWVRRPNSAPGFDGTSALDRILSGKVEDLQFVRRYLDAQLI